MVLNGSFETATGVFYSWPADWMIDGTVAVGSFAWAEIMSPGAITEAFEAFWSNNEDRIVSFAGIGVDLATASFDATTPEAFEDFEEEWSGNEGRTTEMGAVVAAAFDSAPGPVEDYEEEWGGNEGRFTEFVGVGVDLVAAEFDVANDAYEDFEEEWGDNEDRFETFVGIGTDIEEGMFLSAGYTLLEHAETFEVSIIMDVPLVQGTAGYGYRIDPTGYCSVRIFGTYTATLSIQVRRRGNVTWFTVATTDVPGTTDLDIGLEYVRILTDSYNDGTPEAELNWRALETL